MKLGPLSLIATLLMAHCPGRPAEPAPAIPEPQHTKLFLPGDHASKCYRIPTLATAADGSIVAVADQAYEIWFSRIPFEWLTAGQDDGK